MATFPGLRNRAIYGWLQIRARSDQAAAAAAASAASLAMTFGIALGPI